MIFKQINNESKGSFQALEETTIAGEMTYSWAGTDKIIALVVTLMFAHFADDIRARRQ